jgi:hypothetical protein
MELKIVVPTHIWEFKEIIKDWCYFNSYDFNDNFDLSNDVISEQGEAPSGRNIRQKYTDKFASENCYVHFLDCDNLISSDAFFG